MDQSVERFNLSARGYFRLLRVARTVADLDGAPDQLADYHIAEAITFRRLSYTNQTLVAA